MPHASLRLQPGVDRNKTFTLNEAAISSSNLIRFMVDRSGIALVQKLGGWEKYYPSSMGTAVKALWAWEDLNANTYLAVGGLTSLQTISSALGAVDITPQTTTHNTTLSGGVGFGCTTTSGSAIVTIYDTGSYVDNYDSIYIQTPISIGGLVLYGLYPAISLGSNDSYQVQAVDVLGNPKYATSSVSNGGAVPSFATTNGSGVVTVTLNDHTYAVGDSFPVLVSTTVGGVTLFGNYTVNTVPTANTFTITAPNTATSTTTGSENGGNARYVYYNGVGPLASGTGYGIGGYGRGGYGTGSAPSAGSGTSITATDWCLDNWGDTLIASPEDGPIYAWTPGTGAPVATILPYAPPVNNGAFVAMPQRQIVAWGSTVNGIQDPLLVRWCDVNNYGKWIGLPTNQAGQYRIPKGSAIRQGIQGPQQGLLWTDLGLWAMQYVGQPYVYQFTELGTGCGVKGHRTATSVNGVVYWMGQSQFFRLAGDGVEPLKCPIWDVVFQQIDDTYADNVRVAPNSRFGEISWFYPVTGSGGVPTNYVKYNFLLDAWDYGVLTRTAWINESVLGPPIGAGSDQYLYQHEMSPDADGMPMLPSFQTGYFAMSDGDWKIFVDQIWPDMKYGYEGGSQNATVEMTFYVADYPGDTPREYGPYLMTSSSTYLTPRFRGRLVSIKVSSDDLGTWWRLGLIRYRMQNDGRF